MVAAEQNLCGRHQACECRNRWSIGRTRNIVIKTLELILDAVGRLLRDLLRAVLVHTAEQHGHVSPRVGEDETNVLESRKCTCKKQVRYCPSGILRNFNQYRGDIRQQSSTTQRRRGMNKHDGLASVELLKNRFVVRVSQPLVVVTGHQFNSVRLKDAVRVLDLPQTGLGIG